jgi:hypothetical protein
MHPRSRALLLACAVGAMTILVGKPASAPPVIQPGVGIVSGDSQCTLNWIYDGPGGPYGGTAAHCVSGSGARVELLADGTSFGTVAIFNENLDYALIRVDAEDVGFINPALKGHPTIPAGVSTVSTARVGDTMQFSGYGVATSPLGQTRESRTGTLGYNDGTQHYIYGAVSPGDSGGPVADRTDGLKAFGIVNTVGVAATPVPQAGEGGLSLDALLADAAARGTPVTVRLVG